MEIHGPDPITLEGRAGYRYWVHDYFEFTSDQQTNERLSGFPFAVFLPEWRAREQTPIVIGLQGMGAPYQWNGFIVPTLLDMGIGCVLVEQPLAGERSLVRNYQAKIGLELFPLKKTGDRFILNMMECLARDCKTVLSVARDRHGLTNDRVALFGVSFGTLAASYCFTRHGLGQRLLGSIGHADLTVFAQSYAFWPAIPELFGGPVGDAILWLAERAATRPKISEIAKEVAGFVEIFKILRGLIRQSAHSFEANPMTYVRQVGSDRKVRFLVGSKDPLVKSNDAQACARQFQNGECYVVPGMAH